MGEKNNNYRKGVKEMFKKLDWERMLYHDSRSEFNRLVGNPPNKENTFSEIASFTGSYTWFIDWKFNTFLNDWQTRGCIFMSSPIMYGKHCLYLYSSKKIRSRGPYITGCLRKSPKVLVA